MRPFYHPFHVPQMYSHAWQNFCHSQGRNSGVRAAADGPFEYDAAGWKWWKSKPGSPDWDRVKPASATHASACVSSKSHVSWKSFYIPYKGMMLLTKQNVDLLWKPSWAQKEHATHEKQRFTANKKTRMVPPVYLGDLPCVFVNSSRCAHWWGIQHEDSDNLKKQILSGHGELVLR